MEISVENGQPLSKEVLVILKMAIENKWDIYLGFDYNSKGDRTIIQLDSTEE